METLRQRVARHEGLVLTAYPDPLSPLGRACAKAHVKLADYRKVPGWDRLPGVPWTIGYGHTGKLIGPIVLWTQRDADDALDRDIAAAQRDLDGFLSWAKQKLDPLRYEVMVEMTFNLGIEKLMGFHQFLDLMKAGNYDDASYDLDHTLWDRQVGQRADELEAIIRDGVAKR